MILDARPDTRSLRVQPARYHYRDAQGVRRSHVFDIEVHSQTHGHVLASVVPKSSSRRSRIDDILRRIARDNPRLRDTTLVVIDDDNLADWQIQRAKLIRVAFHYDDPDADASVLDFVQRSAGRVSLADARRVTGLGHRTLLAAARLLAEGRLHLPHGERLEPTSRVIATSHEPTANQGEIQ